MPQSAFHYCFRSRQELLREVVVGLLPQQMEASLSVVDRRGSLQTVLRKALVSYWDHVESEPLLHNVLYDITTTALRDPDLVDLAHMQYARFQETASEVLKAVAEIRNVSWTLPLPVLARMLVNVLDGMTLNYIVDRDRKAARAVLDSFAPILAGLAKSNKAK
ncbi:TetR family transcriptional regulator [Antricoccus suffuscus]|uniref:TetR family transcriptional regulator n=2 Tax=Antricoccus suffuscus TaxID=1629062 RepID=A0A2T1A4E0_9ACTN|nr:TetR family transcriptional regulator [Antricoccus suffuscus]